MHDPRLTFIHMEVLMHKDLLLQCMHKAAAQDGTLSISPISLQSRKNLVLILLNSCGLVGVGLGASLKGENQIWGEKRILLYFQIIMG